MSETDPARMNSAVIDRVRALEHDDWDAALELLDSARQRGPSDEIEIELARLRRRGWHHLRRHDSSPPWSEAVVAPPRGPRGLPEAVLSSVDASTVRAAILDHGALLLPNAIPPADVVRLREAIDASIAAHERWLAGRAARRKGTEPAWTSADWFPLDVTEAEAWTMRRNWVYTGGGVLLGDAPRALSLVLDTYERLGLQRLVAGYLGERPVLSANKCTLRRVPVDAGNGWHQDGAFLGSGIRALNIWVALTRCGVEAPGLDIVPRRFDDIVETGTGTTFFEWGAGDEAVERATGELGVVRPRFEAGDVVLFDDLCLHRTATDPTMVRKRHAIELWSFAASAYPADQVPLVW